MNSKHLLSSTWGIPIVLFVLSIFGLLSALTGDSLWDVLAHAGYSPAYNLLVILEIRQILTAIHTSMHPPH
jgi:hypothetical protein